jgi:nucleotide-binding universal stress UspA family protein
MFKKILLPIDVDYPETAGAVYSKAAELARQSGAELHILSILPGFGMPIVASYITDEIREETYRRIQEALERFIQEHCREPVPYTIAVGKNWREIIRMAGKWKADLIVVFHNEERELNEAFSDSCSRRVAEHAPCSVLWLRNLRPETGGGA